MVELDLLDIPHCKGMYSNLERILHFPVGFCT